jgi:hypothetical protein
MFVKTCISIVFSLALTLTPALAKSHILDVPGPALVVLETTAGAGLALEDGTLDFVVLEASPSHLILATFGPVALVVNSPEAAGVVATVTRVQVVERDVFLDGARSVARSLYGIVPVTKEEDHDIDPDPKRAAERPLVTLLTLDDTVVTKEEDHDIDPDPKRRSIWAGDWALASAAIAELGPGWYFALRGGEVATEILVEGR